jgi:septal ring factor EnvC (AmiA/AmiB activator)
MSKKVAVIISVIFLAFVGVLVWTIQTRNQLTDTRDALSSTRAQLLVTTTELDETIGKLADATNELTSTKSELASTKSELASTKTELASTKTELASTKTELTSTKSELASTKSELASTKTELTSTKTELTSTKSQLTSTKSELASTKSELTSTKTELTSTQNQLKSAQQGSSDIQARLSSTQQQLAVAQETLKGLGITLSASKDCYDVVLVDNLKATNPTWSQLMNFLSQDQTENHTYIKDVYDCSQFSRDVHNHAEAAGIRAAEMVVRFKDELSGHALNAFLTTDYGLVYVSCTEPPDTIARVKVGKEYRAVELYRITGTNIRDDYWWDTLGSYYYIRSSTGDGHRVTSSIRIYW